MENNDNILSQIHPTETEISLAQGFITRLIDLAVEVLIVLLIYYFMPRNILDNLFSRDSIIIFLILIAIAVGYQLTFLMLFNKTAGMMVCRVKLLNKNLKPLSAKEKIVSVFRTRFSKIKYYQDK